MKTDTQFAYIESSKIIQLLAKNPLKKIKFIPNGQNQFEISPDENLGTFSFGSCYGFSTEIPAAKAKKIKLETSNQAYSKKTYR